MKAKFILGIFLLIVPCFIFSQSFSIDSLRNIIDNEQNDSIKILAYQRFWFEIPDFDRQKKSEILLEMIDYSGKIKNLKYKALCLRKIGMIFGNIDNYDQALKYTINSAEIFERLGDKDGLANCYNNIGSFYNSKGDFTKNMIFHQRAIDYHLKSIDIRTELHDTDQIYNSFNNIANVYMSIGNHNKALYYFSLANEYYNKIGELNSVEMVTMNIGDCYKEMGLKEKNPEYLRTALRYILSALKNYNDSNMNNRYAGGLTSVGQIYCELGNYNVGIQYLERGLNVSKDIHDKNTMMMCSEMLSRAYEFIGLQDKALALLRFHLSIKDSLVNENNEKNTEQMLALYESSQKDNEINKLNSEKQIKDIELKRNRLVSIFSIIGVLAVAVFTYFVYRSLQNNKRANRIILAQKELVENKNHIIEEKQKEILDSITYAKRIQYTLLAHSDFLKANIPDNFVYFNPKDIVSGDFYWATKKGEKFYLAVCDSTGHGVPGAFMSLLNIGFLSEAINEKGIEKPNEVFDFVRQRLIENISKEGQKDGFDGILICIDQITKQISYAAANNNPILVQNNRFIELDADRMPVGMGERKEDFKLYTIDVKSGDTLYLYTDGYADQFGGPRGKKFKYKQLNELILANNSKSLNEQHQLLKESFDSWKGDLEQVDDVCVIGIRL